MSSKIRTARMRRVTAAIACCSVIVAAAAVESATAPARAGAAGAAACSASNLQIWYGLGEGGGTAGHYYAPLEFSNIGHRTCTLYGYPGVVPYGSGGKQVGLPAGRYVRPHATVTLAPGATAHALLIEDDWGALCTKAVHADGFKVYAPGQTRATEFYLPFDTCAHVGTTVVEPVRSGVGIPGYTIV